MKKNSIQFIRACVGAALLALMGLVSFAAHGTMFAEPTKKISNQIITVIWEIDELPLSACRQRWDGRQPLTASYNGACASVKRETAASDPVCKIFTLPIATHEDIGTLLQWCLRNEAAKN